MKRKIISTAVCILMLGTLLTGCKSGDYKKAEELFEEGDYKAAKEIFSTIEDYQDSSELVNECDYQIALQYIKNYDFDSAKDTLESIRDYKNVSDILSVMKSPFSNVSDKTYFYSYFLIDQITASDYRNQLGQVIKENADAMWNGDVNNVPHGELGQMLYDLEQTQNVVTVLEKCKGDGSSDSKYIECVFAYYFLVMDNSYGRYVEDADHSSFYDMWLRFDSHKGREVLADVIVREEENLKNRNNVSDIEEIIEIAADTVLGQAYYRGWIKT